MILKSPPEPLDSQTPTVVPGTVEAAVGRHPAATPEAFEMPEQTVSNPDETIETAEAQGDASERSEQDTSGAAAKAREKSEENERAREEMDRLEAGDAPTDLADWPSGPAQYLTYGNAEKGSYGSGVTAKLGPANLKRYADGSVSIDGKKVDNPGDYKGKPIPGGPTDPNSSS